MKKRIFFILVIVMVLFGWIWRFVTLNKYYNDLSDQTQIVFDDDEIVYFEDDYIDKGIKADGYWIRIDNFEILEFEEYLNRESISLPEGSEVADKVALAYVTLCNENSTDPGVMLTELMLHGVDSYCGMNWDLLFASNKGLRNNPGITLSQGREYELVLPFNLNRHLYSSTDWEKIDKYEFFLRITFFPTTKDIRVK